MDTPAVSDDVQEAFTFDQSEPDAADKGEGNPANPSPTPSISHGVESGGTTLSMLFQLLSVSDSSGGTENPATLDRIREFIESSIHPFDPDTVFESTSKPSVMLHEVVGSPVAYPPLKSIARRLCVVVDNCQVQPSSCAFNPWCLQPHQQTKVNIQAVESLVSCISRLSKSLCAPIPVGDVNERGRENKLKQ